MRLNRREFLQALALLSSCVPISGCEQVISQATNYMGLNIPGSIFLPDSEHIDSSFHLLSRAAYGPWPGDLEKTRELGAAAWVEKQLNPESIDDQICTIRTRRFESLLLPSSECYEFKREVVRRDLVRHALLRALYTQRQLNEVLVEFWSDHLNINIGKGDCIFLKPFDDRTVIRKHALGSFKKLIMASATSPAMLVYLDGAQNKKASSKDVPNENYARELLELHTLGVHGGYTQQDVYETARCLTGWTVQTESKRGSIFFDVALHDQGEKTVLGSRIPANGAEKDLEQVVSIVTEHPSTAQFIARKLCVRFIAEQPPNSIVMKAAQIFKNSNGSIKETVRCILLSEEFADAKGSKIKRPFQYIASALRMIGADTHAHDPLVEYLLRMGQGPFQHPTPDGYPDESAPWLGTLLWRWNFAFEVCSAQLPSVDIAVEDLLHAIGVQNETSPQEASQSLFRYFVGRNPNSVEQQSLQDFIAKQSLKGSDSQAAMIALVLSSPAFLRC